MKRQLNDHPLIAAIQLRTRAKRQRAHPQVIHMLDLRVKEEAQRVNDRFGGDALSVFRKIAQSTDQV